MSTDENATWGGPGMYEYGHKGLPHALVHASELVQSGGHQAAYSTAVGETAHKGTIKAAAKFARTYASYNESQEGMLNYVLFDILWSAVIEHNKDQTSVPAQRVPTTNADGTSYRMLYPLPYTDDWYGLKIVRRRFPHLWRHQFFSKSVLVTREELANMLLTKMNMPLIHANLLSIVTLLRWKCFGAVSLRCPNGVRRKVVGVCRGSNRRDFVRLQDDDTADTALSAQVVVRRLAKIPCLCTFHDCSSTCKYYMSVYFVRLFADLQKLHVYVLLHTGSHVHRSVRFRRWYGYPFAANDEKSPHKYL